MHKIDKGSVGQETNAQNSWSGKCICGHKEKAPTKQLLIGRLSNHVSNPDKKGLLR